jgi:alpha-D-xyloside xylohydrolase
VRVYRGADGDFTLYDDDGKTYAEGGDQKITRLHSNNPRQRRASSFRSSVDVVVNLAGKILRKLP